MVDLVMIPALGCDARLYDSILPFLPRSVQATTIIADRSTFADCIEQVLAMAPPRFVVMGTSFGGRVAMELALSAPERLQGLIVIGAGPGPVADPVAGRRRSERLRGGEFEQVIGEMAAIISHVAGPEGISTQHAFKAMARTQGASLMARQSDALAQRIDLWPRMADIDCPALMIWGVHDQFSPAADGLRMSMAVQKGRFVQLDECGHFPTLEYPQETASAITHWLADHRLT
jgi:pimeloyl-ACP methyl ester carboxylesterase